MPAAEGSSGLCLVCDDGEGFQACVLVAASDEIVGVVELEMSELVQESLHWKRRRPDH